MNVVRYPSPVLNEKCSSVDFQEPGFELGKVLDEMTKIMASEKGMGLAANQVGIPKRFFIMRDEKGKLWEFINPTITETDGSQYEREGCLSAPGVILQVGRAATISVIAQDRNGEEFRIVAEGIEAVCIQHEIDHLDGIFFTDRVNRQQRRAALREIEKASKR